MIDVIFARNLFDIRDKWHTYAKRGQLPIAPFVGLGVIIERSLDPIAIKQVFINETGALVAEFEECRWGSRNADEFETEDEWQEQLKYLFDGWEYVGGESGMLKVYRWPQNSASSLDKP